MCKCNPYNTNCTCQPDPAFDKAALQESVNLMAAAISRVSNLEFALKNAISVIDVMKGAIGNNCYRYCGSSNQITWHGFALEEQAKLKKVLDQTK